MVVEEGRTTYTGTDEIEYSGVLPSKADGMASNMEHAEEILTIAGHFMHALDYNPPQFSQDPALRKAVIDELESWNIGKAVDGFLECADVGTTLAEVGCSIVVIGMKWMDNVADEIIDPLLQFQSRFHARKPQLHPVLDCYATFMLRLYDYYEPYVADQMVMSSMTFMLGSCIEIRLLSKNMKLSTDALLWPYYVRNLSGISGFYAYACFPKKDHPDVMDYIQAIPDILVFTNFLNDVLSFYKEEMDGELHNYCQTMARVTGKEPIKVLQDISDETVVAAKRAFRILADVPAAQKAFKAYEQGYM
ncbi:hypothetical protein C0989_000546 [Termitomyces sp. Mn162]|nr:hypothetical protein C0989_000546 [Termitomyces sp. Mn162]